MTKRLSATCTIARCAPRAIALSATCTIARCAPRAIALSAACTIALCVTSCMPARPFPWPRPRGRHAEIRHAEVRTLLADYDRLRSPVMVRQIDSPSRANLDFAAYHQNVMINDPAPATLPPPGSGPVDAAAMFGGLIDPERIYATILELPLTQKERSHPLAFTPLVEWLAKIDYQLSSGLEDLRAAVRSEDWGGGGGPHIVRQRIAEAFVHDGSELWLRVEMQPWVRDFSDLPDEDGDGFAEFYVTPKPGMVPAAAFELIRQDYCAKILDAQAINTWANELASFWYPSYMTDLAEVGQRWPDDNTEPEIRAAVGEQTWEGPTVILVGKPQGEPIYNVFVVTGMAGARANAREQNVARAARAVTPDVEPLQRRIEGELKDHGGSWKSWESSLETFHNKVRAELAARDASLKALIGRDGFLFFRNSLNQMVGGDLQKQPRGKNPASAIVAFKETLARRGVDFLFVPVPTKAAVYPDKVQSGHAGLAGRIVTPYERKFLLELSQAGVEIIDLLSPYLSEREKASEEELYLAQDTHWTDRGLRLAARAIARRIRQYPWYTRLDKVEMTSRRTTLAEEGDLPSRLAPAERRHYKPVPLVGHQVVLPGGELYTDVPESPITILGDSFTGVFQRTFCRHAGVSAHIARELRTPVDLVMSYGGGPNVRKRLLRRGVEALGKRRLVVWIMAARDLYDYWEDWELLEID
jgi:alginate O-acetyltransferase complex protein AlgJ